MKSEVGSNWLTEAQPVEVTEGEALTLTVSEEEVVPLPQAVGVTVELPAGPGGAVRLGVRLGVLPLSLAVLARARGVGCCVGSSRGSMPSGGGCCC